MKITIFRVIALINDPFLENPDPPGHKLEKYSYVSVHSHLGIILFHIDLKFLMILSKSGGCKCNSMHINNVFFDYIVLYVL